MNKLIDIKQVPGILEEYREAFFDIPFENSEFQTENFILAAALTPQRAYRAIGLRMSSKIRALQEAQINREEQAVDLDEHNFNLHQNKIDKFEIRRTYIKIKKIQNQMLHTDKLINDALVDLSCMYKHFKRLPRYTRSEFESAEKEYFVENFSLAGLSETEKNILYMEKVMPELSKFEKRLEVQ